MAVAVEKKKVVKAGKARRGHMPTKRTINLAGLGEKPINLWIAIPGILLILAAAVLFSKFMVIDRLSEAAREQAKAAALQSKVNAANAELANFDELNLLYAHYSYSGMTEEEMTRADRVKTLDLIKRVVMPKADVLSWTVNSNQLVIRMRGKTLQEINLIAQELEKEERVEFCSVTTAASNDGTRERTTVEEDGVVTASVIVFLMPETEVNG